MPGGRRLAHLRLDVREQRRSAVDLEEAERPVEPLAVEVGVEVAEAGRQAAAHLPVGGRVRARVQRAAAVAQPEQRVELLDQLGGGGAPADGADADRVAGGGLARDLEDRERDVEPAAQVDVAVGLLLELRVAGRLERLDQAVLEHERAELGLGRLVVDVLGLAGPGRGRREVRSRARAQADRLADVERAAVGVAEDVDARVLGEGRRGRAGRRARAWCAPAWASAPCGGAAATAPPPPCARWRTAAAAARTGRARRSRRRAARGGSARPRSRARRPARPGRAGAAAAPAGAPAPRCTSPAGRATRARRARTPA